jgi:DNA polymerase-4
MPIDKTLWKRAFAHVDMSAFFASIEQLDFPEIATRPVAVVNGEQGTTIITSSYQARAFGIKTGTKVKEALAVCPQLVIRPARSHRYAEISTNIMKALEDISPDIEIYSVDECWIELTHVLDLYDSIEAIGHKIRSTVHQASGGLPCSIGISEGKLTAKFCGELAKGSITIIPPDKIAEVIGSASVDKICGIGRNIAKYLNSHGVFLCKDLRNKPMTILSKRFGDIGMRLYSTCLGHDPAGLAKPQEPKSMGHGKVMPPNTKDTVLVEATFRHICEKLAARLRTNHYGAKTFVASMKLKSGWIGIDMQLNDPISDSDQIWQLAKKLLTHWHGKEGVFKIHINATSLVSNEVQQLSLFDQFENTDKQQKIDRVKDAVNNKFGSKTLLPANMLCNAKSIYTVISPAWRPSGVRNTINS